MKVGKEEAIGMLMAVEMWMKRDHKAEWSSMDVVARLHREACVHDRWRDDVESRKRPSCPIARHRSRSDGIRSGSASAAQPSRSIYSTTSRESPRPADGTGMVRPASPSRPT